MQSRSRVGPAFFYHAHGGAHHNKTIVSELLPCAMHYHLPLHAATPSIGMQVVILCGTPKSELAGDQRMFIFHRLVMDVNIKTVGSSHRAW
jgi:hypothetical protein